MTGTDLIKRPGSQVGFTGTLAQEQPEMKPPTRVRGLVFFTIVLGVGLFGGLGSWAALSPIQSAVMGGGSFRVEGDRQTVQHLEGGIVTEILVEEGDSVEEGDVMVRLDDTRAVASIGILENQLANQLSTLARIEAEFNLQEKLEVPPDLEALIASNPSFAGLLTAQQDLFETNRAMWLGQIDILNETVDQLTEQVKSTDHRLDALRSQLVLIKEEHDDVKQLFEKALISKPRYLQIQRDMTGLMGDVAIAEANRMEILQQIAETEQRILQVRRQTLLEIADQRQRVKEAVFDTRQRLAAAHDVAERITLRAPKSGRIVGMDLNTIGAVIQAGEPLMDIVPANADYVIETEITPDDIDQVSVGSDARVRLTAYNFRTTPVFEGVVTYVSADSFVNTGTNTAFFRVDVKLKEGQLESQPHVVAVPGMRAEVMISTGEHTVAEYLLSPVIGGLETALREPD